MDIRPPVRRPIQPGQPGQPSQPIRPSVNGVSQPPAQPAARPIQKPGVNYNPAGPQAPMEPAAPQPIEQPVKKKGTKKRWLLIIASILLLGILAIAGIWFWYQSQLAPVDSGNTDKKVVTIEEASTPNEIASVLKEEGVIKNETAFMWYTRLSGVQNQLQAGSYRLSPSETTPEVVEHLVNGNVDTFRITFYPGVTLVDTITKEEDRIDVTSVLKNAGYSEEEISAALAKKYDHPLFEGKPESADLEGYVFGETYEFFSGVSVEDILIGTFDEFYRYVEQDNLINAYQTQGLSLYEGITLASIVQRESGGDDKAQIAQVFYSRLEMNMPLGSDVTYQYIADKEGGVRDPSYDSPYNTRRYAGLPPGPIAVPGLAALRAVAMPAQGNYIYFLSGDDHVTYFARTLEEHEANIRDHCQLKCQII
ncbi:MAG: endolytic transglycosylase MltG [Patescibacteria group bacterium]